MLDKLAREGVYFRQGTVTHLIRRNRISAGVRIVDRKANSSNCLGPTIIDKIYVNLFQDEADLKNKKASQKDSRIVVQYHRP